MVLITKKLNKRVGRFNGFNFHDNARPEHITWPARQIMWRLGDEFVRILQTIPSNRWVGIHSLLKT